MQISWFAVMAVLFTAVAAKSSATTTTSAATTSAKESSTSASTKPTKNAAAGNALNNPFAFLRELPLTFLEYNEALMTRSVINKEEEEGNG
ncbi:hypothetical protein OAory_01034760 [Aspergillus oryzae]|nr:uncharacterized protein G4B84_005451 [Aspergillus flavus NRRL3357]OOO14881.1 hypothetical protein OAory_01034760 [Aspergillus oryzae]QMW30116.1 hypothetical protein G4B84_005451 [Aspergillus flavus NRRL3357]QMW42188.1 hypothetical protein G4B11_005512 [Aspergillus flavus]